MRGKIWSFFKRLFSIIYNPQSTAKPFLKRKTVQKDKDVKVEVAALSSDESRRFFGVPMARRGIQPVWLSITNKSRTSLHLNLTSLDPNYYSPIEAAHINHFAVVKRLLSLGVLAWVFLPFIGFLPFKLIGAQKANKRMNEVFNKYGIGSTLIKPKSTITGFAFTRVDEGMKEVHIHLYGIGMSKKFTFMAEVPGLKTDYAEHRFDGRIKPDEITDLSELKLRKWLENRPRATTNKKGTKEGDPLNLMLIGSFPDLFRSFASWDETEIIDLKSSWKMVKAFLLGSHYRYSPVSPLYVDGCQQDVAFQRARETINERLHFRLWLTSMRFEKKPVWIGQISRDIGVRFTTKTWNLTTHKIDPFVDESREYVVSDLIDRSWADRVGYVKGVGRSRKPTPRRNLTGDPYVTDGIRAVIVLGKKQKPVFPKWT
ncbi:hypothetical protein GOV07_00495 [Candidatus Woesearchaeota archaeon]|nr:hypothetical protein [Candidatus Woesearchaeota archaeon]